MNWQNPYEHIKVLVWTKRGEWEDGEECTPECPACIAEASFKAGQEAGRQEVVDWIKQESSWGNRHSIHYCPRCFAIKWAQWLVERHNGTTFEDPANIKDVYALVAIPIADWEQIKKLAEEKVDGDG